MANIKDFIKKIGNEAVSLEEQQQALVQVEQTIIEAKAKREESIGKNVDLVISALKTIESKLEAKLDELNNTPAKQGIQGPVGKAGKDGLNGKDGLDGISGKDGIDGKDGVDGQDGVSVVDAKIDFDGSLVVYLSNGNEIDCGQILSPDVAQNIIINSGGSGTSQAVTDTIASLQAQINTLTGVDGVLGSMAQQNSNAVAITGGTASFTTVSLTGTTDQINAVAVTSDPSSPSAGNLKVFARTQAGFTSLAFDNPTNAVAPFQTMMPFRKISMWNAPGSQSATAPGIFGFGNLTVLGSATGLIPTSTNMVTRTRRINYGSTGTAGSFCGHYEPAANIYLGSATTPAYSGFYFSVRFFIADTVASPRTFIGLSANVAAPTNVQPSTLTNCIGVGQGASDTNLFLYYGGSAAQTPINLGASFPTNTASTDLYELTLFSPPTSGNTVYYQVRRLNTGDIATGTLTGTTGTVLPLNTQVLAYRSWRCNNATTTAVNLAIVGVYCETDF